jgi:hypothetical protein
VEELGKTPKAITIRHELYLNYFPVKKIKKQLESASKKQNKEGP